jgi:hypothetical protein
MRNSAFQIEIPFVRNFFDIPNYASTGIITAKKLSRLWDFN